MSRLTRYLLIALMLTLLPLRGWAAHVMAVDMAAKAVAVAAVSKADMPADCVMPMATAEDDMTSGCNSCDTCELCLAVANLTPASWSANHRARHAAPPAFNASFSSATSASHLKPPIA